MDRHGLIAIILTISIISSTSNASAVFNFRKLIASPPINSSTASQVSPVPSPVSNGDDKGLKSNPVSVESPVKEKPKDAKVDDKDGDGVAKAPPPPVSVNKSDEEKKENLDTSKKSDLNNDGSCEGLSERCDQMDIVACLEMYQNGSKEVFLVVQNKGKGNLKVNIDTLPPMDSPLPVLDIPKHQSKRINISSSMSKSTKLVLNAGSGECVLHFVHPVSVENFLRQLSFYSKQVTPIYGAYFFFLVTLLLGGTWACCFFSKRRRHSEIPYQELEMGLPESASIANVETAEGWDENWDDDWEDDGAVKSTSAQINGSISSNGLTARSTRKEGWEDNWDD